MYSLNYILGLYKGHFQGGRWMILVKENTKEVEIIVILIKVLVVCQKTFKLEVLKAMSHQEIQKIL